MMKTLKFLFAAVIVSIPSCSRHSTPPPVPAPLAKFGQTEVWFAPNIGSDMAWLMANLDQWATARAKVKVFKFYNQPLVPLPCDTCGPNNQQSLAAMGIFKQLRAWGIQEAIEVGASKDWDCPGVVTEQQAETAVDFIAANGGQVSYLASDESLFADTTAPWGCHLPYAQALSIYQTWAVKLRAQYPAIKIGAIEPVPADDAAQLVQFAQQAPIDFLHIDIDWAQWSSETAQRLNVLSQICRTRGIPFGVIADSVTDQPLDSVYESETLRNIDWLVRAFETPQQVIFQSWVRPTNVPTNAVHAKIILEGMQ